MNASASWLCTMQTTAVHPISCCFGLDSNSGALPSMVTFLVRRRDDTTSYRAGHSSFSLFAYPYDDVPCKHYIQVSTCSEAKNGVLSGQLVVFGVSQH
ncbi:hypothetical protein T440DRAFT_179382 [Plenodomus tracheiphilus IPT5]|uniref:Uncharacterized protein n=1 Tax=Plenodomus tracheiphilus IPT5 TaxID=1408161 RepID=A0A6A7AYP3_9PLEO|nr:hypothetical protein T440DRAFT_179382 [Plenodomus tracheiphilus IPT5]